MRRLIRDASATFGACLVLLVLLLAIIGPALTPYGPNTTDLSAQLQPPSAEHWFGTDQVGRDVFTRVAVGARYSLSAGVLIIALAVTAGSLVGLISGFYGGSLDEVLMRLVELLMAFPGLILAMVVAFSIGPSFLSGVLAMAFAWSPSYARLVRGLVLQVRKAMYVEAAHASGASTARILARTILPQCVPVIATRATTNIGMAIVVNAGLSYVGLGAQPPTPAWGAMIAAASTYVLDGWWVGVAPGFAIFLTVLGVSLLGDYLQEANDPEMATSQV